MSSMHHPSHSPADAARRPETRRPSAVERIATVEQGHWSLFYARGIALERLSADGRGEADPLTSNASEEGRVRNRRIELILSRQP